jgi:hypothetical protein
MPTEVIDALAGLNVEQAVCLAVSLFSGSLVPFFLLVDVDFTALWQRLGTVAVAVAGVSREAVRDVAALLILLTTRPKEAMAP